MAGDDLAADWFEDQLTGAIVQRILRMQHGEQLESERELARQLGISRTALRERLSHLESMGVLERRTGAGTFVKRLRPETVGDTLALGFIASDMSLSSLRSVRLALERQASYEAAVAGDPVKIAHMVVALKRLEATDAADELYEADVAFHRAMFTASCSPGLIFFAEALAGVLSVSVRERQKRIDNLTHDRSHIRLLHRGIFDAVAAGNPVEAMRKVDEHFAWLDQLVDDTAKVSAR